jgi:hypothetical protein
MLYDCRTHFHMHMPRETLHPLACKELLGEMMESTQPLAAAPLPETSQWGARKRKYGEERHRKENDRRLNAEVR